MIRDTFISSLPIPQSAKNDLYGIEEQVYSRFQHAHKELDMVESNGASIDGIILKDGVY